VVLSELTPVASFVSVTFTPASTAALESETRPRMRPPVPWANRSVEQIRHALNVNKKRQQDIWEGFGIGMEKSGMEPILRSRKAID
jgi:hypothetical protein